MLCASCPASEPFYRTRAQTASLLPSRKMLPRIWAYCTPSTVSYFVYRHLQKPELTFLSGWPMFRPRSPVLPSRCHPVLPNHTLVVPLPCIARRRALAAVFRFTKDQYSLCLFLTLCIQARSLMLPLACLAEIGQTPSHDEQSTTNSKYSQICGLRALHLLAFFILIYVGVEVTLGGVYITDFGFMRG